MVVLDLSEKPNFIRPELLLHPMIPRSLSGVNPRRIKGKEWWNEVRKAAYAENNYCCWSCGAHRMDTPEQLLDGHETYEYNFDKRTMRYEGTVALCRRCHEFIHFNTLSPPSRATRRLLSGIEYLRSVGIKPPYPQMTAVMYRGYGKVPTDGDEQKQIHSLLAKRWTLEFEHKPFKGR